MSAKIDRARTSSWVLTLLKMSSGLTPTTSAVYPRMVRDIRSMVKTGLGVGASNGSLRRGTKIGVRRTKGGGSQASP